MDPRHHFLGRERLGHIIVRTDLETEELVVLLAARRKHDDRRLLELPDLFHGGKPVQTRHHDVHQNDIVIIVTAHFDRFHAIAGLVRFASLKFDVFAEYCTDHFLIIYDQYLHDFLLCLSKSISPFL